MGKPRRRLPFPIAVGTAVALRAAMSAPLIAGSWPATCAAEALGRWFGGLGFNRARFARAEANLRAAFPGWDEGRVRACAEAAYAHLFRLAVEFFYTPRIFSEDNWVRHFEISGVAAGKGSSATVRALTAAGVLPVGGAASAGHIGAGLDILLRERPCVLITGHCGNWEILGYALATLGFPMHALYRPLDNWFLDRWVRGQRQRAGLVLIDKFGAMKLLPEVMGGGRPVAFVADQNAGDRGLFVPYFGRLASTYKSIGLMAMQFEAPVVVAMSVRVDGLGGRFAAGGIRHHICLADVILPEDWKGQPDPLFYLTARYRRALEKMVRAAPEQYLWMHRIWKSRPRHERDGKPVPRALAEKIRSLPWLSAEEAEGIVERSGRESAERARELEMSGRAVGSNS